jgi:hypothetical protein
MNTKSLVLSTIALTLLGGAIAPKIAQAELPMRLFDQGSGISLTVPDSDTTLPAYGGRLRLYDIHIAKMFEVTYHACTERGQRFGLAWFYSANNGKTNMGTFRITCRFARQIVDKYGLGKYEPSQFIDDEVKIRTLNITGDKVEKWIKFTRDFKPE